MSSLIASFPTLKIASTELCRVVNVCGEGVVGKVKLGKHKIQPKTSEGSKVPRPKIVFDILNKGLTKQEERMVRKILRNADNFT